MQYITAGQAAEKWSLTKRRVQDLCRNNQIDGVVRWGRDWMIPVDAVKVTFTNTYKEPAQKAPGTHQIGDDMNFMVYVSAMVLRLLGFATVVLVSKKPRHIK